MLQVGGGWGGGGGAEEGGYIRMGNRCRPNGCICITCFCRNGSPFLQISLDVCHCQPHGEPLLKHHGFNFDPWNGYGLEKYFIEMGTIFGNAILGNRYHLKELVGPTLSMCSSPGLHLFLQFVHFSIRVCVCVNNFAPILRDFSVVTSV